MSTQSGTIEIHPHQEEARKMRTRSKPRQMAAAVVMLMYMCLSLHATLRHTNTIANLKTMTGMADGDVTIVESYYSPANHSHPHRGGGSFKYASSSSETDDGGHIIQPASGSGRWHRLLNGETPNIDMWGARFDASGDSTVAIQNAVNKWWLTGEIHIPQGTYTVTNTIIFYNALHLKGSGPWLSVIKMRSGSDVFRTYNAHYALTNGAPNEWDHGLIFENLRVDCGTNSTTNAALVLVRPGEAHTIRNILTQNGGYGIRSYGVGAPGLKVMHSSFFLHSVAGVSIEGYLPGGTNQIDAVGPVSLIGLSGDSYTSLVRVYRANPVVSIYDFKAEGPYTNGLFYYEKDGLVSAGGGDIFGSVSIYGGTWNAITPTNSDLLVLKTFNSYRTATVYINNVNLFGMSGLIRDDLVGRRVKAHCDDHGLAQSSARLPLSYESRIYSGAETDYPAFSRLTYGGTARYDLYPPTNGWYRVMINRRVGFGADLAIISQFEATRLLADDLSGSGCPQINVTRPSMDTGRVRVTKARIGSYRSRQNNHHRSFLDILVERMPESREPITLAQNLGDEIWNAPLLDGDSQLLFPTNVMNNPLPAMCDSLVCVTNSLTR